MANGTDGKRYVIASLALTTRVHEHILWMTDRHYSVDVAAAKIFTGPEAVLACRKLIDALMPVEFSAVESLARGCPYIRGPDGYLEPMYGFGVRRVVPNSRGAWHRISANALDYGVTPMPATPITRSKSRAIYVPDGFFSASRGGG